MDKKDNIPPFSQENQASCMWLREMGFKIGKIINKIGNWFIYESGIDSLAIDDTSNSNVSICDTMQIGRSYTSSIDLNDNNQQTSLDDVHDDCKNSPSPFEEIKEKECCEHISTTDNLRHKKFTGVSDEFWPSDNNQDMAKSDFNCLKMIKETAQIINQYDAQSISSENEIVKDHYIISAQQLIDILLLSGCTELYPSEGDEFSITTHRALNPEQNSDSAIISKVIRPGIIYNNQIYVRAIVEIQA